MPAVQHNRTVRVGLESNDGQSTLASATFTDVSYKAWTRYSANLTVGDTDTAAQLRLSFPGEHRLRTSAEGCALGMGDTTASQPVHADAPRHVRAVPAGGCSRTCWL